MCDCVSYLQMELFESIRPLFANKPLIIVANKTDIVELKELSEEQQVSNNEGPGQYLCILAVCNDTSLI